MSKVRCKDCQYFDGVSKCEKYDRIGKRNMYDECVNYEHSEDYRKSNHRDSIENIVNDIANLVDEEKCFMQSEENYKLEVLSKRLLRLVENHGIHSWKYSD